MYHLCMFRRLAVLVAILAMILMAASPLYEVFDRWDNIPATGNDTALTLVVIGACIGLCFALAAVIVGLIGFALSLLAWLLGDSTPDSDAFAYTTEYLRLLFSPPLNLTSLRI